jgi:protein gp37
VKGFNVQGEVVILPDGRQVVEDGIEWTKRRLPDGSELSGLTWAIMGGCLHDCTWRMPDGTTAECYAKSTAEGRAASAYPLGFRAHYFRAHNLLAPTRLPRPTRIFIDAMGDLLGRNVPTEDILRILAVVRDCPQHVFISLTKNPGRYSRLRDQLPRNLWAGFSSPPDTLNGRAMSEAKKVRYVAKAIRVLATLPPEQIRLMSVEPLSFDVAAVLEPLLAEYPNALQWMIIGAASRGKVYFQPDPGHLQRLIALADRYGIPLFYKGNLRPSFPDGQGWREEFPTGDPLGRTDEEIWAAITTA